MCCIFTFCGWMLDLMQRCWVFFMSCCISTAVCCVLVAASTSGIALGYNYSLAEYIDLRETNVSVYIKRGVFDDEIADDMEWRRAGHKPDISGLISDKNLRTGAPADQEETTVQSGRRLDDSIYESGNQHQYEGSLLRLTAKQPAYQEPGAPHFNPSPPFMPPTSSSPVTGLNDPETLYQLVSNYPVGSLDHLKAIQTVINARRSGNQNDLLLPPQPETRRNQEAQGTSTDGDHYKFLESYPGFPGPSGSRRNMMNENDKSMPSNTYRDAVPRGDLVVWNRPFGQTDYSHMTMPPRPTYQPSPIRPPVLTESRRKEKIVVSVTQTPTRVTQGRQTAKLKEDLNEDLDKYKQRLLMNQYDAPNAKADDFKFKKPLDVEEYDEEIKGAPVRKKRRIDNEASLNDTDLTSHHITNQSIYNSNLTISIMNYEVNMTKNESSNFEAVKQYYSFLKVKWRQSKMKKKKSRKSLRKRSNRPKRNKYKNRRQRRLNNAVIAIFNGQKKVKIKFIHVRNAQKSLRAYNATSAKPRYSGNITDEGKGLLLNKTGNVVKLIDRQKIKENITNSDNTTRPLNASHPQNLFNF